MPVHPLDSIDIKSPCTADWDSMVGNDVVRFCRHCDLDVHDLSLMTREEALALVRRSKGRLCLRYIRRPDGTIQTAPSFQKLHLIKRRASKIVAGAFGATLSLCASVAAQTPSATDLPAAEVYERPLKADKSPIDNEGGAAVLAGTVMDTQKAVIPGAVVTLINESTGNNMTTQTNDEGQYRFQSLAGGTYTLFAMSQGFVRREIRSIDVASVGERRLDAVLEVGTMGGGMIVVAGPTEPLIQAAVKEDAGAVRQLIAAGADVNVVDKGYGTTPLIEAVSRGNGEIVELLLSARADVDAKNERGYSAILSLSEKSTGRIVRALIQAGAKLNDRNKEGDTPLLIAAAQDRAELVRALVQAGARLDEQNEAGQTALMIAAREGHVENVRALLDAGANVRLEDADGWTALKYARLNSHFDIAELLKTYGIVE